MKSIIRYCIMPLLIFLSPFVLWFVAAKITSPARHFGVGVFQMSETKFDNPFNDAVRLLYPSGTPVESVKREIGNFGFSCDNPISKSTKLFCTCFRRYVIQHSRWVIKITVDKKDTVKDIRAWSDAWWGSKLKPAKWYRSCVTHPIF